MVDALSEASGEENLHVRRSTWARWIWLPVLAAFVAVGGWHATHPAPLPPAGGTVSASTPTSSPVSVGVLGRTTGEHRSISLRDVDAVVEGGDAEVEALVCRGSAFAVTTDPNIFCDDLGKAVGGTLDLASGAAVGHPAGRPRLELTVLGRRTLSPASPPGTRHGQRHR